jgi:ribosomal protein S12 methylthiotransferase accessory factor
LFLASLATCAGYYVMAFCQARGLSLEGITLRQHVETDATTHLPARVRITLGLPGSFPEKYRVAVLRAAEGCKVKKTIAAAPTIEVALDDGAPPLARAS